MTFASDQESTLYDPADGGSSANEPWIAAGFDQSEIDIWRKAVLDAVPRQVKNQDRRASDAPYYVDFTPQAADIARVASRWRSLGFSPREVTSWTVGLDIDDAWLTGPDLAEQWRTRGFSPKEAHAWSWGEVAPGDDPEHSRIFRDAGWHHFMVWTLYCLLDREGEAWADRRGWSEMPQDHALNCARAGLTPGEAASFVGADEKLLERYLADRFDVRGRIDPFIAMLFNHHQWQASGWEDNDTDRPFYARHLWDLHDEQDDCAEKQGGRPPYGGPRTDKPRWKLLEERAEWVRTESVRRRESSHCPNSGGPGQLEFRDGFEEWKVHCPECGTTWAGGGEILPNHDRR
jgi:hypothetical protein